MVTILRTEYKPSARFSTFDQAEAYRLVNKGWQMVNEPKYEDEPYVVSSPTKILVTFMTAHGEETEDCKNAIIKAYNKYYKGFSNDKIIKISKSVYSRFVKDLEEGRIEARRSRYPGKKLYFVVQ